VNELHGDALGSVLRGLNPAFPLRGDSQEMARALHARSTDGISSAASLKPTSARAGSGNIPHSLLAILLNSGGDIDSARIAAVNSDAVFAALHG